MVAVLQSLAVVASTAVLSASVALATPDAPVRSRSAAGGAEHVAMPHVAPADVGMSGERLAVIDRVVGRAITAAGFPGAAVIVGRHGAIVWERGSLGAAPGRRSPPELHAVSTPPPSMDRPAGASSRCRSGLAPRRPPE